MDALQVVEAESAAVLAAARRGLDAEVPGCPGWQVRELVGHLGRVQRWHGGHLGRGVSTEPDGPVPVAPADDDALLDWYAEGVDGLLDALRRTDPAAPAWTFAPHVPQVAAFWSRRMALEAAVHRWDAESAHGTPAPIDLDVAADGVDEVLRVHLPADLPDAPVDVDGVVDVRLTDTGQAYRLHVRGTTVGDATDEPAAVLAGPAGEVLLALWGRRPLAGLVQGDAALAAALRTG